LIIGELGWNYAGYISWKEGLIYLKLRTRESMLFWPWRAAQRVWTAVLYYICIDILLEDPVVSNIPIKFGVSIVFYAPVYIL